MKIPSLAGPVLAMSLCLPASGAMTATLTMIFANTSAQVANQTDIDSRAAPTMITAALPGSSASADALTGRITGFATTSGSDPWVTAGATGGGVVDVVFRNDGTSTLVLPLGFLTYQARASYSRSFGTPLPPEATTFAGNSVVSSFTLTGGGFTSSTAANVDVNEGIDGGTTTRPGASSFGGVTELAFFSADDSSYLAQYRSLPFSLAPRATFRLSTSLTVSADKGGPACPPASCSFNSSATTDGGNTGILSMILPDGVTAVDINGDPLAWAVSGTPPVAPVPLPASVPLFLTAFAGLVALSRRAHRSSSQPRASQTI